MILLFRSSMDNWFPSGGSEGYSRSSAYPFTLMLFAKASFIHILKRGEKA